MSAAGPPAPWPAKNAIFTQSRTLPPEPEPQHFDMLRRFATILKLARILDCSPEYLTGLCESPRRLKDLRSLDSWSSPVGSWAVGSPHRVNVTAFLNAPEAA